MRPDAPLQRVRAAERPGNNQCVQPTGAGTAAVVAAVAAAPAPGRWTLAICACCAHTLISPYHQPHSSRISPTFNRTALRAHVATMLASPSALLHPAAYVQLQASGTTVLQPRSLSIARVEIFVLCSFFGFAPSLVPPSPLYWPLVLPAGIPRVHSGAHMRPVARPAGRQQQSVWALAGRRSLAPQTKQAPRAAAPEPQPKQRRQGGPSAPQPPSLRRWQAVRKPKPLWEGKWKMFNYSLVLTVVSGASLSGYLANCQRWEDAALPAYCFAQFLGLTLYFLTKNIGQD